MPVERRPTLPTYGMTETFGQVATLEPGSPPARRAHPLPGIQLRIGSDRLIAVRGRQVSPGYLGEPDRTDPWFVTGDLGELDSDGALRVLGRADTVIVTGGENVDPARVEAVVSGAVGSSAGDGLDVTSLMLRSGSRPWSEPPHCRAGCALSLALRGAP